jgi:hypothetical protein
LFGASFAVRVLYWRATSDASWPHTAAFKGDALLWLEYARALHEGRDFELGLPIHPPGTAYLIAALWRGSGGFALLKVAWCALGAAAVAWSASSMARAFGPRVGAVAGVIMAASSGLLMLSASLNGETPYLAVVAAGFLVLPWTVDAPSGRRVAAWSALSALACLFRVEHVLFVVLALAFMAVRAARQVSVSRAAALLAIAIAAFTLPLVPWHVTAWRSVARFDDVPPPTPPPVRQVLDQLRVIEWDPGARARLAALPAFARDQGEAFIAATVAYRGGTRVRDADFDVLRDAFGSAPAPIRRHPFVSLYGPLNFALANHPEAGPGFGHAALDIAPPLAGGPQAYPGMLIGGLPPRELAFTYPPHVALVNDGYAMGLRWIAADPPRAARRALSRLARFWAGAATALSGYGLPAGLSGTRYAVDITVASGAVATAWRIALLVVALAGLVTARRHPALYPWLFFFAARVAPALAFFGYARLGATAIPVVALLVALAVERFVPVPAWDGGGRRMLLRALGLLMAIEAARWLHHPALALDGDPAGPHDPVPAADHTDHELKVQF